MSWYVVDVEADGPCPGLYSMVQFGVVRLDETLSVRFRTDGLVSWPLACGSWHPGQGWPSRAPPPPSPHHWYLRAMTLSIDWIGWLATAVFVSSYFSKQPKTLRRVQGLAACLWCVYGALIAAMPVVVANVIVATVAIGSSLRRTGNPPSLGGSVPV